MTDYRTKEHKVLCASTKLQLTFPLVEWANLQEPLEHFNETELLTLLNKAVRPAYLKIIREGAKDCVEETAMSREEALKRQLEWRPPPPKAAKPKRAPKGGAKRWDLLETLHKEAIAGA